ncbi:MAG: discoidin domain-containing protein [Verrucomicrobia bacterium]|nr:discoidin domain-containing protein [Verrucomicrobiota bacterium]
MTRLPCTLVALLAAAPLFAADAKKPAPTDAELFPPQPPVPTLSPAEQLKKFQVPDGYKLELVLAEPDIKEPVTAVFDGNGRMFVAEMRTYMQDIDGTDELKPKSRVSLHWSSKGDGKFDKHTVFADNLLLPRMILPLGPGELLINETDTLDIYLYRDTDGDGVADKKELWYAGGPRGGNLEHQQSGLIWCTDNWLYMTYNAWRLRWQGYGREPLRESTAGNGGQWGLTQDDHGKPWFVNAGGERGPLNFQTHIAYGAFNIKNQFPPDYMEVWPLVGLADVQGGYSRFRPEDKTLNHFTATCGAEIFRGDRLPEDLRGDLLFSEPVGRLIRRTKAEVKDGLTYLRNAYDKSEFIRSTDANFRVVNMNTAPDGTLYLVDMYRGIIQEGNWTKEGSYLRKAIKQHSLDKNIAHGRIWRLTHKDFTPGPQPKMNDEKSAQLVAHLEHPNGWWRDTAQKLLVIRQDQSVAPALATMALRSQNYLARTHALWTLEGLGALDARTLRLALSDPHPQVRAAAIRASETLYKAGDKSWEKDIVKLAKDKNPDVAIQSMLTAKLLNFPDAKSLIQSAALGTNAPAGLRELAMQMIAPPRSWGKEFSATEKKLLERGDGIFKELCFACHNPDGRGAPVDGRPGVTQAPPLAGSRTVTGHKDGIILVLLKGLTGPVADKTYEAQMVSMESNDDEWIASIASYVRNSFGNKASTVTPAEVARVRAAAKARTEPWTVDELRNALPQAPLTNRRQWKLTASHNAAKLSAAVDGAPGTRWDTGKFQVPGMWVQIELPQETPLAGLLLDSSGSGNDYPRGYTVELSGDGQTWNPPVATGKGTNAVTEIQFAPAKAKFIRITQTGSAKGNYWSVHELDVLEPPTKKVITAAPAAKKKESFE